MKFVLALLGIIFIYIFVLTYGVAFIEDLNKDPFSLACEDLGYEFTESEYFGMNRCIDVTNNTYRQVYLKKINGKYLEVIE